MLFHRISSVLISFLILSCNGEWSEERSEILDSIGNYIIRWSVDYEESLVRFNIIVRTLGWVGFGLSTNGGMTGADIILGGVLDNMQAYFNDCHATGFRTPVVDDEQNWFMLGAAENSTHTSLQFQRSFDTCDDQDLPITNDTISFIWSYGDSDYIGYHGTSNRGSLSVNILDIAPPSLDLSKFQNFEITQNIIMPSQDTTYWCSVIKSPSFGGKRHFVAFDVLLPTPQAKRYTHHYTVYKCIAPEGMDQDDYFGPHAGSVGAECWDESLYDAVSNSRSMLYVWAIGGKIFTLPDNVGYPVGETTPHEYYLLEVHYDNPEEHAGIQFETGAVIYYTDELRT